MTIAELNKARIIKIGLKFRNKNLLPNTREIPNTASETAPRAKSLVTLTGSELVFINKKTETRNEPEAKNVASFFST
jgi:hypothetical protein